MLADQFTCYCLEIIGCLGMYARAKRGGLGCCVTTGGKSHLNTFLVDCNNSPAHFFVDNLAQDTMYRQI